MYGEQLESSYIAGETIKWWGCFGKLSDSSLKSLIVNLYDPELPLLAVYLSKITCTHENSYMKFIVASFMIAKSWNNPDVHEMMDV